MLSLSFPLRQTTVMTDNNSNNTEDQPSIPEAPCRAAWKRTTDDDEDRTVKRARVTPDLGYPTMISSVPDVTEKRTQECHAPFYHYRDYSQEVDPDPLTPLTPPGRVPNFPAKMHAILSRPDLTDIVAWMPHGRSWRVLKPREFELRVIPTYFEHSKFSSFVRQANGWGFRRITQGRDRNSYYHELFLRGLPHLCKQMKRPGVAEKASTDAEHEPDFQKISELFPVPVRADDESILLHCTVQGGPKARMPIYSGAYLSADKIKAIHGEKGFTSNLTPRDHESIVCFHNSLSASENQLGIQPQTDRRSEQVNPMMYFPQGYVKTNTLPPKIITQAPLNGIHSQQLTVLEAADRLTYDAIPTLATPNPLEAPTPASQFAAGFAAATALSTNHIRNMMGQAFSTGNTQTHPKS
jgi:hypothetical protein